MKLMKLHSVFDGSDVFVNPVKIDGLVPTIEGHTRILFLKEKVLVVETMDVIAEKMEECGVTLDPSVGWE